MRLLSWSHLFACSRVGLFALALLVAAPLRAETPALLSLDAGVFDFLHDKKAGAFDLQYRGRPLLWWFRPVLGAMFDTDNAAYAYGGLALEIWFGSQIVLTPDAVVGAYGNGDRKAKNLGNTVEFRTGADLAWRFQSNTRLGIGFHHISNAGIGKNNPGTELITVNYAVPFESFLKTVSP